MQLIEDLHRDVVYALRTLRRAPGVAAAIIATFALAIGANAAMFGLVTRLLLGVPSGVSDAERVTRLSLRFRSDDGQEFLASTTSYPAARAGMSLRAVFSAVAAVRRDTLTLGSGADLDEAAGIAASGEYFAVLGPRPLLGRFFDAQDDALPDGSNVVVLSHSFWRRRFAGDRTVLGREITIESEPFTIIGVAARDFTGDELAPVDLFVPLAAMLRYQPGWYSDARINLVEVIARLAPGATRQAAGQRMAEAVRASFAGDPRERELIGVELASLLPGSRALDTAQGRMALWLAGVALVVLLIATANVGTLLLLRAIRRRREQAVRLALGVGRARLARQLLTESLLLTLAGSAAGLLLSVWIAELVRAELLPGLAATERFIDVRVLLATAATSCTASVLAAAPALQFRRRDIVADLKAGSYGSEPRSRSRSILVGVQVALSTALLVGTGLFVKSLHRVQGQDLGFSTSRLLFVTLDFRATLPGSERDAAHFDLVRRVKLLPGVTAASVVDASPFASFHVPPISVPGRSEPPNVGGQLPTMYGATSDYLRMMGVRAVAGRLLTDDDGAGSPLVVLVNQSMARRVWPGESAVGKCIRVGFDPELPPEPLAPPSLPCREVVGVVRDSRVRSVRTEGNEAQLMQFYVPFRQLPSHPVASAPNVNAIVVETAGDPATMMGRIQRLMQGASTTPVYARVRPYQDLLDPQLRPWRLGATLFSAFGALALGIAMLGLFAVISYLVTQRTMEIGVRMALGGSQLRIGGSVVGGGVKLVAVGIAGGLMLSLLASPFIQPLLFQTSARDVTILGSAAVLLVVVAGVAALVPAWRAARMSPLLALRAEK